MISTEDRIKRAQYFKENHYRKELTQAENTIEYLTQYETITSDEALIGFNCRRLAAVIFTLKERGYPIEQEMEEVAVYYIPKNKRRKDVVKAFNRICSSLEPVVNENALADNIIGKYSQSEIETVFQKAEENPYLTGKIIQWKADFEWLMNEGNFRNILNGVYDIKEKD